MCFLVEEMLRLERSQTCKRQPKAMPTCSPHCFLIASSLRTLSALQNASDPAVRTAPCRAPQPRERRSGVPPGPRRAGVGSRDPSRRAQPRAAPLTPAEGRSWSRRPRGQRPVLPGAAARVPRCCQDTRPRGRRRAEQHRPPPSHSAPVWPGLHSTGTAEPRHAAARTPPRTPGSWQPSLAAGGCRWMDGSWRTARGNAAKGGSFRCAFPRGSAQSLQTQAGNAPCSAPVSGCCWQTSSRSSYNTCVLGHLCLCVASQQLSTKH